MAFVKNSTTGVPIFVDERVPREKLAAMLSSGTLTDEPTAEERRDAAKAEAAKRVDADKRWSDLTTLAEGTIQDTAATAATFGVQLRDLREDAWRPWHTQAENTYYNELIATTETVTTTLDAIRDSFAADALPMPITVAETAALGVRLSVLDSASPTEAKLLIEDAVARSDAPFLVAAGIAIRSWTEYKNAWKAKDGRKVAEGLLDLIDLETWTPARSAAEHAGERADAYAASWRFLANTLDPNEKYDPLARQTGALSPLLDPEP